MYNHPLYIKKDIVVIVFSMEYVLEFSRNKRMVVWGYKTSRKAVRKSRKENKLGILSNDSKVFIVVKNLICLLKEIV